MIKEYILHRLQRLLFNLQRCSESLKRSSSGNMQGGDIEIKMGFFSHEIHKFCQHIWERTKGLFRSKQPEAVCRRELSVHTLLKSVPKILPSRQPVKDFVQFPSILLFSCYKRSKRERTGNSQSSWLKNIAHSRLKIVVTTVTRTHIHSATSQSLTA